MSSSLGTSGGSRDASGHHYFFPRDRGDAYSAVATRNTDYGDGGGGAGVYVPPALVSPVVEACIDTRPE